ncbi:Similar to hypothetical protein [Tuber melanosporum Mel28]; acc. no. XP_002835589 [Pyronema omphalodes CBS 100304]|uniref:Uncharacterized protein n=1 Tax=Pyronema omphalodes (strain CBS 100304) TaxID=1076935 RepID=U4LCE6_PYROM|nr:Similar to hypothetical protein [Tuber melanosporum Mel28]; acc. no. XP_002835589 [Pyronema omphalodes CBS 100304]
MPFQSLFQKPANRSSTPLSPPPNPTSRPSISAPIPTESSAQYGRPTISTQNPRTTISLVPPEPRSAAPSPLTPSPGSRGGDFAAEQPRSFQHQHHDSTDSNNIPNYTPSAPSTASSSSARHVSEASNQPQQQQQQSGKRPTGLNFFSSHRDKDRSVNGPTSPPLTGLSRKLSTRYQKQHQSPPPLPDTYQHLSQQHSAHSAEDLDPYLHQQGQNQQGTSVRSVRPHSVLPSTREAEVIDYALNRGGEYNPSSIQRHDSFSQASLDSQHQRQPNQYYEAQGKEYQNVEHNHQKHIQQQQQELEDHNMPAPRPSGDMMRQPPSRDASNASQLQPQQQQYNPQRTNTNESYQQHQQQQQQQQGLQNQAYDPSKFEDPDRATPEARSQSRVGDAANLDLEFQQCLQELETLQLKYRRVKTKYFERGSEIEKLQNQLAHQRLAQSRTSLDDNEYTSRFERLDGAIKNVAFEIRQSWKTIPPWLTSSINMGAATKGGREMTVVGRAAISRWVVEEVIEAFFHPALEPNLSSKLKDIEGNIRLMAGKSDDDDALSARICNWRLTTLDALHNEINSPAGHEMRTRLAEDLVNRLVSHLKEYLHDPAPIGLLGGVQMVVDIAVGLISNLPIESREIKVWYPQPGSAFNAKLMKGEGGLPPLGNGDSEKQVVEPGQGPGNNNNQAEEQETSGKHTQHTGPADRAGVAGLPQGQQQQQGKQDAKKPSGFSGRVKKALHGAQSQVSGQAAGQQQPPPSPGAQGQKTLPQKEEVEKIRMAGFFAVEVRGRSILVKAPVWL